MTIAAALFVSSECIHACRHAEAAPLSRFKRVLLAFCPPAFPACGFRILYVVNRSFSASYVLQCERHLAPLRYNRVAAGGVNEGVASVARWSRPIYIDERVEKALLTVIIAIVNVVDRCNRT